jgi:hypothetical protein
MGWWNVRRGKILSDGGSKQEEITLGKGGFLVAQQEASAAALQEHGSAPMNGKTGLERGIVDASGAEEAR